MMRHLLFVALAGLTLLLPLGALRAGPLNGVVEASLIPGWRMPDGRHVAGLRIALQPGWKTYWRAPGDVGLPPEFDWRGSDNLAGVEITWPAPHRFDQGGVMTIGYKTELILPLTLTPLRGGHDITLRGDLNLGVCQDVCMPVRLKVSADLPRDVAKPDPRIAAALAARPFSAREAGVSDVRCMLSPGANGGLHLRAEVRLPDTGAPETLIVETDDPQIWVAPSRTVRHGARLIAETDLLHAEGRSFAVNRSGLRLTVLGNRQTVDIQGCPAE